MILLLLACTPTLAPAPEAPLPRLEAWVDSPEVATGAPIALTVEVRTPPDWRVELGLPEVEGLKVEADPPEELGTAEVSRMLLHARYSGPDGSWVIPPVAARLTDPQGVTQELQTTPIYVDLGVEGPTSALQDLALAPPPPEPPWALIGGAVTIAVLAAGAAAWSLRRRDEAPPPPTPADVAALRAWEVARSRLAGQDHALALELSAIFRRYLEAVTPLSATTLTSFELIEGLRASALAEPLVERCKRLLTATDLIKFARDDGGEALFAGLDADLRAVVMATRPREPEAGDA